MSLTSAQVQEAVTFAYLALREDPDAYARLTSDDIGALTNAVMVLQAEAPPVAHGLREALAPFVAFWRASSASRDSVVPETAGIAVVNNNVDGDTTITVADLRRLVEVADRLAEAPSPWATTERDEAEARELALFQRAEAAEAKVEKLDDRLDTAQSRELALLADRAEAPQPRVLTALEEDITTSAGERITEDIDDADRVLMTGLLMIVERLASVHGDTETRDLCRVCGETPAPGGACGTCLAAINGPVHGDTETGDG